MNALNNQFALKDGGYSNFFDNVNLPRHRWYFYKEGFSPNLVRRAIEDSELDIGDLVVDPFNGSGTTTLTSTLLGLNAIGVEVNPFTHYLAKAKQTTMKAGLAQYKEELFNSLDLNGTSPLLNFSTFSEASGNEKWLFNSEVLNAFENGWNYSNSIKSYNSKRLIRLALIISAMNNCNAKKDGKCLRYRPTWKEKSFNKETLKESLSEVYSLMNSDIKSTKIQGKSYLFNGDIRNQGVSKRLDGFKLCITSPPYLNTFDYTDIYRPELFLGKFVSDNRDLYNLRLRTVRSHIQAKWPKPKNSDFGTLYAQTINKILSNKSLLMHKNIPLMIQAYFDDMERILLQLRKSADKDASLWMVVSNSAYAGLEVPVDLILGELGTKVGWYLREVGVLRYLKKRKTKYSANITQLRESVIIFDTKKKSLF